MPIVTNAGTIAQISNPINKIARIINPQLVKVEDRVMWLERKLSTYTQRCDYPLKVNLGYRGGRGRESDPDPSVTLDLGRELAVDQIYMVPAQKEFLEDSGLFPKQFTIEFSKREDFAQRTIVYTSGSNDELQDDGWPVVFGVKETTRYVRLTVHQGHDKGTVDLFALAELAVISHGETVSFDAKISTVGAMDSPGIWTSSALIDGRTPLGIWQNIPKKHQDSDDAIVVKSADETVTWTMSLDTALPINHLVLFPYQSAKSLETAMFPEALSVRLYNKSSETEQKSFVWKNPLSGTSEMSPLVIPLGGISTKVLKVTATRPWTMGDEKIQALSEIQIWSQGINIAPDCTVHREHGEESTVITGLNDGYNSIRRIMPFGTWLQQLIERGKIEQELVFLKHSQHNLAAESELSATWGSAVVLGLTFLIPVFLVERRRLSSNAQLDLIRKRIASDLHDDIGSNLGCISLIARTARRDLTRLHGPEEIADDLNEMESIARESSLAIRDIVWLLERRQDSIGDLVQRMRETANRLLREIHYTVDCNTSKTASRLSLDAKRHLFLFYKEAIHNVLKHSKASNVSIRLWDENDKLALEIIDNGVGIPAQPTGELLTVSKLEDRARVLDGTIEIQSAKESGTRIFLLVKPAHLTSHPMMS